MNREVLVVDDKREILDLIRDILEEKSWEVWTAHDIKSALALIKSQSFDAVISDIDMGRESGFDFFELACKQVPEISKRFAFMSGRADYRAKAREIGCLLLHKPLDILELHTTLEVLAKR